MKKNYSEPLNLRIIRKFMGALSIFSPGLAGQLAYKIWIRTHRSKEPAREVRYLENSAWEKITLNNKAVQLYIQGEGVVVAFAHGWNGRGAQLAIIATVLQQAGYKTILFDAPGHGRSEGNTSSAAEISQTLQIISDQYGPIETVITHSLGGLGLLNAVKQGLVINKAVCIAPPLDVNSLTRFFSNTLNLTAEVENKYRKIIENKYGTGVWGKFSMPELVKDIDLNGMIIHDKDDTLTRFKDSERTASTWPGCQFIATEKLGHMRILRDEKVCQSVLEFVRHD